VPQHCTKVFYCDAKEKRKKEKKRKKNVGFGGGSETDKV
jgi:hypothetical protein